MTTSKRKQVLSALLGFVLLGGIAAVIFLLLRWIWRQLVGVNPDLAVGVLTAGTTVIVATLTVVLGRYYERKRETEAHFRDKKVEIYDAFLKEFFEVFHGEEKEELVSFLREWQRKMIVWGGADVLKAYIAWMKKLRSGQPDAQSIFLMEDFFHAVRRDLGLSNKGLTKGLLVHLVLRHPELFLAMSRENPAVTLEELGQRERELGLEA